MTVYTQHVIYDLEKSIQRGATYARMVQRVFLEVYIYWQSRD